MSKSFQNYPGNFKEQIGYKRNMDKPPNTILFNILITYNIAKKDPKAQLTQTDHLKFPTLF